MGDKSLVRRHHPVLAVISNCYSEPKGRFPRVTHPCATRPEGLVRLACVRHAASVRSEPGSNSQVDVTTPYSAQAFTQTNHTMQNFGSRCLHNSNVMDTRDIQARLNLNCHPEPKDPRKQAPSPTCPFIYSTMSKSYRQIQADNQPSLGSHQGGVCPSKLWQPLLFGRKFPPHRCCERAYMGDLTNRQTLSEFILSYPRNPLLLRD